MQIEKILLPGISSIFHFLLNSSENIKQHFPGRFFPLSLEQFFESMSFYGLFTDTSVYRCLPSARVYGCPSETSSFIGKPAQSAYTASRQEMVTKSASWAASKARTLWGLLLHKLWHLALLSVTSSLISKFYYSHHHSKCCEIDTIPLGSPI